MVPIHVRGTSHVREYQITMYIKYLTVSHFSVFLAGTLSQALDNSWTLDNSMCVDIEIFLRQITGMQSNSNSSLWLVAAVGAVCLVLRAPFTYLTAFAGLGLDCNIVKNIPMSLRHRQQEKKALGKEINV